MNILDALDDENLFKQWLRDPESWQAWRAFLAALFALPMTEAQRETFQACTALETPPEEPSNEAWLICGRRAGKSFMLALIAVYLAVFKSYAKHLAPGERGTVLIIAADRKQSRVVLRYIGALLREVPMLSRLIERTTAEAFDLNNRVTIEVGTASYRTTRGYTFVAVLADELAFWRSEDSASPDYEVLNAVRPGMSTIPGAILLCASSPYARRGALWDAYQRHYGKDSPALVWKAATRTMNPTVPQSFIDDEMERDPSAAAASTLLSSEQISKRSSPERPWRPASSEACARGLPSVGTNMWRSSIRLADPAMPSRSPLRIENTRLRSWISCVM